MIAVIAAMAENRVIGNGKQIPWKIPGENNRFNSLTKGHTVIMGRKTFDALGCKPIPNVRNIIITRSQDLDVENCEVAHSLFEAITMAEKDDAEIYIGGGQTIYEEALPLTDRIYLTIMHDQIEGNMLFPRFSKEDFVEIDRQFVDGPRPYTLLTLQRKKKQQYQN